MIRSEHHLAVLALPGSVDVSQALSAIDRLQRAGALTVLCASLVERHDDGTLEVAPVPPEHADQIDATTWRRLLAGTLQGLSESFMLEVGEALRTAPKVLAFVVTRVDPAATVDELRHLPRARLVYGALPPHMLESLLTHDRR